MSMNQPPNHPQPEDGAESARPGQTPPAHGSSAAPPPYGSAPGDYTEPGTAGSYPPPAPAPEWDTTGQPGYGQAPYAPTQPPQGFPPGSPSPGYYPPAAPQGQYPPGYYYAVDPPKSRLAAGLLGIFLGGFGVHRFYLGYTSIGVVQILVTVFTWGIGAVWGFVEGIMILAGAQSFRTDARGVPLRE